MNMDTFTIHGVEFKAESVWPDEPPYPPNPPWFWRVTKVGDRIIPIGRWGKEFGTKAEMWEDLRAQAAASDPHQFVWDMSVEFEAIPHPASPTDVSR